MWMQTCTLRDSCSAVFVTWTIQSAAQAEPQLRGCIGTFQPLALQRGLEQYTIQSAFHDRRFQPIALDEVPRLQCAVSLLSPMEPCTDFLDWDVGTHGVYIVLLDLATKTKPPRPRTATFLPEIAPAQRWSKVQTIDHALRKAGWTDEITDERRAALEVYRYTSDKCTVAYDAFEAWQRTHARGQST